MTESIRAFIALEIPDGVKTAIGRARDPLRAELPRARWVRVEAQHLTLKFLGEAPRSTLDALVADLAPTLVGLGGVRVALGGAGFFPSLNRPRVAWLGGMADGVDAVAGAVEEAAEVHGFPRERRPWSLHLTQARLNRPWPREAVDSFIAWGRNLDLEEFVAGEVALFSSRLEPGGAVYTALQWMPFQ